MGTLTLVIIRKTTIIKFPFIFPLKDEKEENDFPLFIVQKSFKCSLLFLAANWRAQSFIMTYLYIGSIQLNILFIANYELIPSKLIANSKSEMKIRLKALSLTFVAGDFYHHFYRQEMP